MAVQQNKKSPAKRGMHRAHDFMAKPPLGGRAGQRRSASAASHQPERVLPRQEGRQDQSRRVIAAACRAPRAPLLAAGAFAARVQSRGDAILSGSSARVLMPLR